MKWLLVALGLVALCMPLVAEDEDEDPPPERDDVMSLISARPGEAIADVGCGTGTWTFPLSRAVGPHGHVYAVDIDPRALEVVRKRIEQEGVENVSVIPSVPDDPMLPPNALDVVFLNDVIDYVERHALAGFLAGIRQSLKPNGRLVIRDPNGGPDRIIAETYRAGFALLEAKIPLSVAPARSFSTNWYALKLQRSDVQHAILPRLGRPARYRTRLHLAEELFRSRLIDRETLRAKWEAIRDTPGSFDPRVDDPLDLVHAAACVGVLTPEEVTAIEARLSAPRDPGGPR
jgi:ubiquinone/menaquinone biosynthesis C-methylase UbiE